jgi:hypothetical protein
MPEEAEIFFPSLVPMAPECYACERENDGIGHTCERDNDSLLDMDTYTDLSTEVSTDVPTDDERRSSGPDVSNATELCCRGVRVEHDEARTATPVMLQYSESPEAFYNLGMMYKQGTVVEQDKAKAVELYERAHAAGHVKATYNLGLMYQRGEGVKQDSAKAAEFYEAAHEKGYSRATYNLGKMYELGVGVERDSVKASDLFQQVATCADDAEGRFASRASLRKYLKKSHVFTIDVVHRND